MSNEVDSTAGSVNRATEPTHLSGSFQQDVSLLRPEMVRIALRYTRNATDAEDLVQDTMLKAFTAYDKLRPDTYLKAWLVTIMRNTWISNYRSTARRAPETLFGDVAEDAHPCFTATGGGLGDGSAESVALGYVIHPDLEAALGMLSEETRATMFYVAIEGMRCREVAKMMGVPTNTVLTRMRRGKNAIRRSLLELAEQRRLSRIQPAENWLCQEPSPP